MDILMKRFSLYGNILQGLWFQESGSSLPAQSELGDTQLIPFSIVFLVALRWES